MTSSLSIAGCAVSLALSFATPAAAQDLPVDPGSYWDVSAVDVVDGKDAAYLDWLATGWKKSQDFAKSKGYIDGYHVLTNAYPRAGEPDLYLVTIYKKIYDTTEEERQRKEYEAFMKSTTRDLMAQSGGRATMRKVMSQMMLREWTFRK